MPNTVCIPTVDSEPSSDQIVVSIDGLFESPARLTASALLEQANHQAHGHHFAKWASIGIFVCLATTAGGFALGHSFAKATIISALPPVQQAMLSQEGSAGAELAQLGQARNLLECNQVGWKIYKDFCYPLPLEGKVVGWRIQ